MISVEFHNTVDDSLLKFAVILSRYQGKWLFCQHRDRDTYECPGGRREAGTHGPQGIIRRDRCSGLHPDAVKRIFGP